MVCLQGDYMSIDKYISAILDECIELLIEESPAAKEAHKRGLESAGYGNWRIPGGPVVAKSEDGGKRLVKLPDADKSAKQHTKKPTGPESPKQPKPTTQSPQKNVPKVPKSIPKDPDTSMEKNKTLAHVDTSNSQIYRAPLQPSKNEFIKRNEGNWASDQYHTLKGDYRNGKFPSRYVDVVERMLNTRFSNKTKKWSHFSDLPGGLGQVAAQAGELMTLMGTTMDDETANQFFTEIMEVSKAFKKAKGNSIVDPSWVKAAMNNRKAIMNRLKDQHGLDVEVMNGAWDTKDEVEAMGLSDYENNKGFSTDVYFKVKTSDGQEILDEVSLKKDINVNFLNSGTGNFIKWDENLPPEVDSRVYSKTQTENLRQIVNGKSKEIQNNLRQNPNSDLAKTMKYKKIESMDKLLQIKRPNRAVRKVMLKAVIELAKGGDKSATKFLNDSNENHKKYIQDAVAELSRNPKLQQGMMNDIRNEFPLKAVAEGEESMAIGPYSMDPHIIENIFGTRDFNQIKDKLTAEDGPPPFIAYRAGPKSLIPIALIAIREDGVGYGGQFKFEMKLDNRFAKVLKTANQSVYGA